MQAPRRLPIIHLGRLGFDLSSCLVKPDIFSDPARSAAAAGTPRTPADYGFTRRPPATVATIPPPPQRRPSTLGSKPAAHRPAITQRRAAHSTWSPSTATSPSTPQPDPPHHRRPRIQGLLPGRRPLLCKRHLYRNTLSSPLSTSISVPASTTTPNTDWARDQRVELLCSATLRFLSLGSPSQPPDDLLDYIPSTRRQFLAEVLFLTTKGQLLTTDDSTVLLVHRPHTDSTRHARDPQPPPLDPPPRVYVPMLMRPWVRHTCHSTNSCYLGVFRTLSMLKCFYWWIVMDIHPLVDPPLSHVPSAQDFEPNNSLAYPFLAVTNGPGILVSVDNFGPLPLPLRRNAYILLLRTPSAAALTCHYKGQVHRFRHGRHPC